MSNGFLSFASGVSPEGLQLKVLLNSARMQTGGAIGGQAEVVNALNQNVSVSKFVQENENVTRWGNYISICPYEWFVGYAVFEGRFTSSNISVAGDPLRLAPPMISQCGAVGGPPPFTFLPNGGRAFESNGVRIQTEINATTLFCNTTFRGSGGFSCAWAMPGLVGYWNYSSPNGGDFGFTSPAFVRFSPGEYTLVAWDDWNQYVYVAFVVL
jgi:hypothetical protein